MSIKVRMTVANATEAAKIEDKFLALKSRMKIVDDEIPVVVDLAFNGDDLLVIVEGLHNVVFSNVDLTVDAKGFNLKIKDTIYVIREI